jgi:hypothetical protein
MEFIRDNDELVVVKLDRLGRSSRDTQNLVHDLEQKGARLRVLEPEFVTSPAVDGLTNKILRVTSGSFTHWRISEWDIDVRGKRPQPVQSDENSACARRGNMSVAFYLCVWQRRKFSYSVIRRPGAGVKFKYDFIRRWREPGTPRRPGNKVVALIWSF